MNGQKINDLLNCSDVMAV